VAIGLEIISDHAEMRLMEHCYIRKQCTKPKTQSKEELAAEKEI